MRTKSNLDPKDEMIRRLRKRTRNLRKKLQARQPESSVRNLPPKIAPVASHDPRALPLFARVILEEGVQQINSVLGKKTA
jgi:hypothetical protein